MDEEHEIKPNHDSQVIGAVIDRLIINHDKIINDWCEAYLAKEYQDGKDIHPGMFTIIQQPYSDHSNFGYKYFIRGNSTEEIELKNRPEEKVPESTTPNDVDILTSLKEEVLRRKR
ncbi:MAG: hypothetical protein ABFQ95_01040 [Pseudomonadota bacterium]